MSEVRSKTEAQECHYLKERSEKLNVLEELYGYHEGQYNLFLCKTYDRKCSHGNTSDIKRSVELQLVNKQEEITLNYCP